jgi:transcriptional regulator with XRE-family HTH domain
LGEQRRLTQEQLAFEAQIDLAYMGGIERGKRSDLIASCMATVCLVAAGYFFGTKPPQLRLRRPGICSSQPRHTKIRGLIEFQPSALPTA